MREIDVICPVYAEGQGIGIFHERLTVVLAQLQDAYRLHIIYVVDPAGDDTEAALEAIAKNDARVEIIVMSRRFGHQMALVAGLDASTGDAAIMLDSDMQHPPELIAELVRHWEDGGDIVQAVRTDGQDVAAWKRLTSRWFYKTFMSVGSVELKSGAADFRLLSRRVVAVFREQLREHSPFLRGLVSWVGFNVRYVPFQTGVRVSGTTKYRLSTLVEFAINGVTSFSKMPLRLCIGLGMGVALLSVVYGVFSVIWAAVHTRQIPGFATLITAVSFIGGIQLFFLGVLSEYIAVIFDEVKDRPRYLVARRVGAGRDGDFIQSWRSGRGPPQRQKRPEVQGLSALGQQILASAAAGADLGQLVSRRKESLFAADIAARDDALRAAIAGKRILVVGGGGTIGSATTGLLFNYEPAAVLVADISENYLVELVRTLRGRPEGVGHAEFQTIALDYGGPIMARMLAQTRPFDVVLNFAALKHVRSEKDVYSLLHMLHTNVVAHVRFKEALERHGHGAAYFAVSTDKAANPSSLMGASKRLMENVAFDIASDGAVRTTSTRFANVAFSNGSLLQGFLHRLAKGQPIAAPRDTRRYFVSEKESGELCLIAAFLAPDQHIAFPRLNAERELQLMQDVATRVIAAFGYEAAIYEDEDAARRDVASLSAQGRWPLILTPLDTSGEKPFEEFVGADETEAPFGLSSVSSVRHSPSGVEHQSLLAKLERLIDGSEANLAKEDIVDAIKGVLPTFSHKETGRSLDDRL